MRRGWGSHQGCSSQPGLSPKCHCHLMHPHSQHTGYNLSVAGNLPGTKPRWEASGNAWMRLKAGGYLHPGVVTGCCQPRGQWELTAAGLEKVLVRINPHPTASHCGWCMQGLAEHSRALPPPFVPGRIQELETSSTCVCPGMVAPAPSRGPSHLAARPGILVDLPRSWTSFHS